ncbi:hypothetical protein [Streptomyces collinus]|uniref:hypothetical protein n=1 Tax=Streptomyces collinus TaxID=42684 RepID=UPI0036D13B64
MIDFESQRLIRSHRRRKPEKKVIGALLCAILTGTVVATASAAPDSSTADRFKTSKSSKASVLGCPMAPASSIWRKKVSNLKPALKSRTYVNSIGNNKTLKADFGSGNWEGHPIGIPVTSYDPKAPSQRVSFTWASESDKGPYPIPQGAKIEGGTDAPRDSDRHVIVFDSKACFSYELYHAFQSNNGSWTADSGAVFDLRSNRLRPNGWTSADAAGLPILPGLVRYDEVKNGVINHALRITVPRSKNSHFWPARHHASSRTSASLPPMGLRLRLKGNVNITRLPRQARVIAQALKTYGAVVADNGSAWYVSGTQDNRWNNGDLRTLGTLKGSQFEAVDVSHLQLSANSGKSK